MPRTGVPCQRPSVARFDRARILGGELPGPLRERRELALDLAEAALDSVEPGRCTRAALRRLVLPDEITAFAFGKASVAMARAAAELRRVRGGVLVALEPATVEGFTTFVGAHPDPASDASIAGRAVRDRARALGHDDTALCLVSGGGSSMLELPREGIELDTLRSAVRALREGGADIAELNAVRRACSQLKGGGLARLCAPAKVCNVVLSDVPGHPLEVVASGPSCAPPADAPDPRAVLARYGVALDLPPPGEGALPSIRTVVAASNETARRAVVGAGRRRGLTVEDRPGTFASDAASLGRSVAARPGEGAWIWGGETTVVVRGAGRGGRNQELLLGALAGGWSTGLLLAFGTDGIDGSSEAAGALIDEAVVTAAAARAMDPARALDDNDSSVFFDALGASLRVGPTGTNVADLLLYLL